MQISGYSFNILNVLGSKLWKNFCYLSVLQIVNYLLPLFIIPFLFNRIGVEKYGLINFSVSFIQYFMLVTEFGYSLSGTRYVAANFGNIKIINDYYNSVLLSRIFLSIICFLVLLIILFIVPFFHKELLLYIILFGQVIGNSITSYWFFQGVEQMKHITSISIFAKFITLCPLFFIVKTPSDYLYIPIFYSFGSLFSGISCLIIIYRKYKLKYYFTSVRKVINVTQDSAQYFLSRISVSLFTNTNAFVLGIALGNIAVGYYSIADKVYQAFSGVYNPLITSLFPYMTKKRSISIFYKIFIVCTTLNIIIVSILVYFTPILLNLCIKDVNEVTINSMRLFFLIAIVAFPNTLLGYPFLAALGHPKFTNLSLVVVSFMHIVIIAFLWGGNLISIYTVILTTLCTETTLLLIRLYGVYHFKIKK